MILNSGTEIAGFTASRILRNEHRVIERGLEAAETMANARVLNKDRWDKLIQFFKNFVEGCHHAKEEDELFPILKSASTTEDLDPIKRVLEEHECGRTLLDRVEANLGPALDGKREAIEELCRVTNEYVSLLRQQIRHEDRSLFAMADEILGPEEQVLMAAVLDRADQVSGHACRRSRYAALADELYRQTRVVEVETEIASPML